MKLPSKLTNAFGRQTLLLKKHSPVIMFSVGVAGTVTATVLACKATLQLEDVLDKHEASRVRAEKTLSENHDDYSAEDHKRYLALLRLRAVRDIGKLYAPAAVVGVISLGLLTGAHVTLTRRNAALGAAYAALDKAFREYRERVRFTHGDDADREFLFGTTEKEIVEETEQGHEVKTVKRAKGPHSPYARVFDRNNECWSESGLNNRAFLMAQQNYLNDLLQARGHVMLNDAYDLLRMERSQAGAVVGWVKDSNVGDRYIDFGLFNSHDPVMRDFMNLEHNDGIVIDFNVDGVVNDLIKRKY